MTRYAAKAAIRFRAGTVEVQCSGADAETLAIAVEAVLVASPPWRTRTGTMQASVRRSGRIVTVDTPYAGYVERKTGGIRNTIDLLMGTPPGAKPAEEPKP